MEHQVHKGQRALVDPMENQEALALMVKLVHLVKLAQQDQQAKTVLLDPKVIMVLQAPKVPKDNPAAKVTLAPMVLQVHQVPQDQPVNLEEKQDHKVQLAQQAKMVHQAVKVNQAQQVNQVYLAKMAPIVLAQDVCSLRKTGKLQPVRNWSK
jgi:hypothetical protein